jgi:hypothetical protein
MRPLSVFCSYSHKDERWRQRLEVSLSQLHRDGIFRLWHDRRIMPGMEWAESIDEHLEAVNVILILVSADFLASEYCMGKEVTHAMERHEAGAARVVPVIARPCDWHTAPFGKLQALPPEGKPLQGAGSDTRLTTVAQGLRVLASHLAGKS